MKPDSARPRPESLLAHAGWLQALARSLVADPATADDLLQETYAAALARPPASEEAAGAWMGRVLRNFVRQRHRGDARRERRERERPGRPGLPSGDELVERMELQRRLVEGVLALREPYRSAIVLRFYEGRSAAEIAREKEIPAATVRSHVKRGLEELRRRLDEDHGGDRAAWLAVVLPWLDTARPAAAAGGLFAVLNGVLAMNTMLKAGLAVGVTAVAVVGYRELRSVDAVHPTPVAGTVTEATALAPPVGPEEEDPAQAVVDVAAGQRELAPATVADQEPEAAAPAFAVEARAVDRALRPIAGAVLRFRPGEPRSEPSGSDGRVRVAFDRDGDGGLHGLAVSAGGWATAFPNVTLTRGETSHLGDVVLVPGGSIAGTVVDRDGAPLEGVSVRAEPPRNLYWDAERARREGPDTWSPRPEARTDAYGAFRLDGVATGFHRLWAGRSGMLWSYEDGVEVRVHEESGPHELVLEPIPDDFLVSGVVLRPDGSPFAGAGVRCTYRSHGNYRNWMETAGSDGRFAFVAQERVEHELRAEDAHGRWSDVVARASPGGPEVVLQFRAPRWIELEVRSAAGVAIDAFTALTTTADGSGIQTFEPEEGRPGFVRLLEPTETFGIEVEAEGFSIGELGPFAPGALADAFTCTLDPLPGIRGRVLAGGEPVVGALVSLFEPIHAGTVVHYTGFLVRYQPWSEEETRTDGEGRFLLTPRESLDYVVTARSDGRALSEVGLPGFDHRLGAELEIVLGRGGAIEGRVKTRDGEDPTGAVVAVSRGDVHPRSQRVGPDGRFRFERLTPGPWNVEFLDVDFDRHNVSSTHQALQGPPPEPTYVCEVVEGETTFFDLDLSARPRCTLAGRLVVDGRPAAGWGANLRYRDYHTGREAENPTTYLEADGSFELSVPREGVFRLTLETPEELEVTTGFLLQTEIELVDGETPWSLALETGRLEGSNAPPATRRFDRPYYRWTGPDGSTVRIAIDAEEDGTFVLDPVPAGRCEIVRFPEGNWRPALELLGEVVVPAGATARMALP